MIDKRAKREYDTPVKAMVSIKDTIAFFMRSVTGRPTRQSAKKPSPGGEGGIRRLTEAG